MLDELRTIILGQTLGNFISCLILVLLYYNFLLFEDYWKLIVWVFLISQALRGAKEKIVFILEYLSDDRSSEMPLLDLILHSAKFYVLKPYRRRTSLKLLILNYGIFIFAIIGFISVLFRVFSWFSIAYVGCLLLIVLGAFIRIVDRKIFYYRYFISDDVLVSTVLIIGLFSTGIFVVIFLGTESFIEGSKAASDISAWVQDKVINDEYTRKVWTEQMEQAQTMVHGAIKKAESTHNETVWWPILKSVVTSYVHNGAISSGNSTSFFPSNFTIPQAFYAMKDRMNSFNVTSAQLSDWTSTGFEFSSLALGSFVQLIIHILTVFLALFSLGIRAVFFVTALFYQLSARIDPLEKFVNDMLPISAELRPSVLRSARLAIEGVFFLPVKISSLHAIVTLVSFNIVNAEFQYLATFITFFFSVLPIIPAYLVCFPWVLTICMTQSVFLGLFLFAMNYVAFMFIDDALYVKSLATINSYVTALSIVFGYYVFGYEGVVFGPLIVCAGSLVYEVSGQTIKASAPDAEEQIEATGTSAKKLATNREEVRMVLQVDTYYHRKVRFVACLSWSYDEFIEEIRRTLKLRHIVGVFAADGTEIISVKHIDHDEKIFVKVVKRSPPYSAIGSSVRTIAVRGSSLGPRRNRSASPHSRSIPRSSSQTSLQLRESLDESIQSTPTRQTISSVDVLGTPPVPNFVEDRVSAPGSATRYGIVRIGSEENMCPEVPRTPESSKDQRHSRNFRRSRNSRGARHSKRGARTESPVKDVRNPDFVENTFKETPKIVKTLPATSYADQSHKENKSDTKRAQQQVELVTKNDGMKNEGNELLEQQIVQMPPKQRKKISLRKLLGIKKD